MEVLITMFLLFAPLAGSVLAYVLKVRGDVCSLVSISISLVASLYLLGSTVEYQSSWEWLPDYQLSIQVDSVSLVLTSLVSLISILVHIFSMQYMRDDEGKDRYFFKLGFFTFSMIGLLLADHFILLFIFWELVGLASYLLIGFWYKKEGVPAAARLAFMVNRVACQI